ncbi:MAG: glycosyltransferase family 2 protein [Polyangiaceae bacterium]|nr:glycosyltransferase family 2 protein [Polyangiaceae bacterium]
MSVPTVAAVIVNWNSKDDVLAGVASLLADDPSLPIVVVDNGSVDGSVEALRERFPGVDVLATGENLGFAEGCNRGILRTDAEWVYLFNNDAVSQPGALRALRAAAAAAPGDVGMIQPCIVFTKHPDKVNSSGVVVFTNGSARDRHFGEPVDAAREPSEPFCTTAGAALYRREMLDQVRMDSGYLDRSFFMYYEDVDLGWRCRLGGWRAMYVPDAVVRHKFRGSSGRRGASFVTVQCKVNRIAMLLKLASPGMLLRSAPKTAWDVAKISATGGLRPLLSLAARLPSTLRERRAVHARAEIDAARLERRWIHLRERQNPAPKID